MSQWMIYGAYGYSGRLICETALERGHRPLLAGRDPGRVGDLAAQTGLDGLAVDLADTEALRRACRGLRLVMHCAGPFSATSRPMLDACLAEGCHYLDITGEISVFEAAHARHEEAADRGIVVCPGAGFDVIPTDCLAAMLKRRMPDAVSLALGFDSRSGLSPGTAKTAVEGLARGGMVRRDGKLLQVPLAYKTRRVDFGRGEKNAMTIPWGDVATAGYSTGIPDIEVYVPASPRAVARLRKLNLIRPLLGLTPVQSLIKSRIEKKLRGPGAEKRARDDTHVWGETTNAEGTTLTARITTANGYTVTAHGAVALAEHLLRTQQAGGYYTPSQLAGPDLVSALPGTSPVRFS